ncbi:hypothetical protein SAMN05192542_11350 [Paraburkholderia caballeronis]|uniref:Lipoprotein n=1 Tax=Paraburkholderia caballeronis TaxID=416943 RepID=A0A1H7SV88_9BURK|nr:hypothetical protein C7403_105350 [Paraburkholderia caballeronis]PXX01274.1 hypothetical protein C7407_105349 [Paraburkholderia caballeronis]RAJ99373.1 hypothetical protein C7409_105102 [Paraburkholderia caballeronis]SEL76325.1 hypothetical protein SAMN05192542_11350 [Paraburkholderia caballeronis]
MNKTILNGALAIAGAAALAAALGGCHEQASCAGCTSVFQNHCAMLDSISEVGVSALYSYIFGTPDSSSVRSKRPYTEGSRRSHDARISGSNAAGIAIREKSRARIT